MHGSFHQVLGISRLWSCYWRVNNILNDLWENMRDIRAISHTRLRARDQYTSSTLIGGKGGAGQVCFTLHLRDQRSTWMQGGCKVYMYSYMASNGSRFTVTWTTFKNHLLEAGLTQNREIMALRTLTTVDLFYFIMSEDRHGWKFIEMAFGWGPSHV